MSSEMREVEVLLNKWLVRYNELIQMDRTNEAEQVLRCINEGKRTLLARTEAVADGADVRETLDDRLDWLKKVSGPAKAFQASNVVVRLSTAEESLRMLFAASLRTHPQDASGDAELIEAVGTYEEAVRLFGRTSPSASRAYCRMTDVLAAMQAKEAK